MATRPAGEKPGCFFRAKSLILQFMKHTVRKVFSWGAVALVLLGAYNYQLIRYGIGQARGQLKIIWQARPVAEVLADPGFPDSLKQSLRLVGEIKQFAVDSLGLLPTDNYTTLYDQQGQEVLWVVTACAPYRFAPRMWSFPLVGSFTYKGFFDHSAALNLAEELRQQGYDVELRAVSGWSTLGWFNDPILSNMLAGTPGELAGTIIHELTHSTIFVPDSMTFNENLATFIGNKGALAFLRSRYGPGSGAYREFRARKADAQKFTRHIVRGARMLDSLYRANRQNPDTVKQQAKALFIARIVHTLDTVSFHNPQRYQGYFVNYQPNNAYFISFLNYRERQQEFRQLLVDSLDNDLAAFVRYWQHRYGK